MSKISEIVELLEQELETARIEYYRAIERQANVLTEKQVYKNIYGRPMTKEQAIQLKSVAEGELKAIRSLLKEVRKITGKQVN